MTGKNLPILKVGGKDETTVGNYFVANYPPFSFWSAEQNGAVLDVLERRPPADVPLGLYVHIPFCRKRCDFCYFKVYTDKNATQIRRYLDAVIAELGQHVRHPYIGGRDLSFIYFGGGTPSYLSTEQLEYFFQALAAHLPWRAAREVAFECEPGTLQEKKVHALRNLGVTRLSLGIENFDPHILEINNRAHRAAEIDRAWAWARTAGFAQINLDLIAGMVGESDDNWRHCIERTIELAPESVTIYQMEIPYNTTVYRRMQEEGRAIAPVADWATKRRWQAEAFAALERAGYVISSAYTASRGRQVEFLYRDALWHGADMLGIGVSSFSHLGGVHFQNEHRFDPYVEAVESGVLPLHRALVMNDEERLIREFALQMKLGHIDVAYFQDKFSVDVRSRFGAALRRHERDGYLSLENGTIRLTREGLLQVDRLLPDFFLEKHRDARYA